MIAAQLPTKGGRQRVQTQAHTLTSVRASAVVSSLAVIASRRSFLLASTRMGTSSRCSWPADIVQFVYVGPHVQTRHSQTCTWSDWQWALLPQHDMQSGNGAVLVCLKYLEAKSAPSWQCPPVPGLCCRPPAVSRADSLCSNCIGDALCSQHRSALLACHCQLRRTRMTQSVCW